MKMLFSFIFLSITVSICYASVKGVWIPVDYYDLFEDHVEELFKNLKLA